MQRRSRSTLLLLVCVTIVFTGILEAAAAAATTTMTITTSANPVQVGQPETITFTVTSSGSSPLTGTIGISNGNSSQIHSLTATAAAYSLNVTVVPGGQLNYLTVWPIGQPQPPVSLLNSIDGRVKANAAIVPAGTSGAISVFASSLTSTDVLLDINGYFVPTVPSGLAFFPLTPCRVVDTRRAAGPLGGPTLVGGQARAFPVQSSNCKIPATAQAYSFSFIAISKGVLGYLSTWPTGQAQPTVSTLHANAGVPTANAAIVPAGSGGSVSVYVTDNADLVLDVNGYFAPPAVGGVYFHTVTPCRVLDTRNNTYPPFPGTYTVSVQASSCGPPAAASAYVLNATVVPSGPVSYFALWPSGVAQPTVSTLNASDGAITSNMAIVPTNNGAIDSYSPDATQLLLDLSGYFAP
jgi:hypothetical protein